MTNVNAAAYAHSAHFAQDYNKAPVNGTESGSTENTETDQVSLSADATALLNGKNPKSPAQRAKAALATEEFSALSALPFGRLVSTLAHGGDFSSLLPEQPATAGEETVAENEQSEQTQEANETGETGETGTNGETGETTQSTTAVTGTVNTYSDAEIALSLLSPTVDTAA